MQKEIRSNQRKLIQEKEDRHVSLGRHRAQCRICSSPDCQQIEEAWTNWSETYSLAKRFGVSRDAVYRHAHALGLFHLRRKNLRGALEQIVERIDQTRMNGPDILEAIKVLLKMDKDDKEKGPSRDLDFKSLFCQMSPEERTAFANDGSLPDRLSNATEQSRQMGSRTLQSSVQPCEAAEIDPVIAAGETRGGGDGIGEPEELCAPTQQNAIVVFTDGLLSDS